MNDSDRIGFVVDCLFQQALDVPELRTWALSTLGPGVPDYVLDLVDFDAALFHLFRVIGFTPEWVRTPAEEEALYGIAFRRKGELFDCPVPRSRALARLAQNPQVLARFRTEFPFVTVPGT